MPKTKKPCHGCGSKWLHEVGTLCESCKDELEKARKILADQFINQSDIKIYHLSEAYYNNPRFLIPSTSMEYNDGFEDKLRRAFYHLIEILSNRIYGDEYQAIIEEYPALIKTRMRHNQVDGCSSWIRRFKMNKNIRKKLNSLFHLTNGAVNESYKRGFRDGSSILKQLANGDVSIEDYNNECINAENIKY